MAGPKVLSVTKTTGVAGQIAYTARVQYPGEPERRHTFVGSMYGGPVVFVATDGHQQFVRHPERFGRFGAEWVRRFYGGEE